MTQVNLLSSTSPTLAGSSPVNSGNLGVLVADAPPSNAKPWDHAVSKPVEAAGPDGRTFSASLVERVYGYGETRYYVDGVELGQHIKTETAARVEVARLIGQGKFCQSLAPEQKAAKATRVVALTGGSQLVQSTPSAGQRSVVEIKERQGFIKGQWQVTGYVATRLSTYSIESYADSKPRTEYGYPLESQAKNTVIRNSDGSVCATIGQAHQRVRQLVAAKSLTASSASQIAELKQATPLPKAVSAMNSSDRVKYLLQETLRQLPSSAANELKAMLTSPQTWAVMGAFLVAGAIPGVNVGAMVVGALLLGNDALDTGGKMVDAVKSALNASSQAELVTAGKELAEALVHGVVTVAMPVVGKRVGKAINTTWKANTSAEAIALKNFRQSVAARNQGKATNKQVAQAAALLVQAKRNTANDTTPTSALPANASSTPAPQTTPQTGTVKTQTPRNTPNPVAATAQAAQGAMKTASEGVFTDQALQARLAEQLAKDSRTNPAKNATASIDAQVVQNVATRLLLPKLLQSVFGNSKMTKSAAEAFTARANAWAKQESPSNPAGALERLVISPVSRGAMVKATVLDCLTGSGVASMKALGSSQPAAARALSARRLRLADALDRAYPDTASQAKLLEQNAGGARTELLRQQVGVELGESTPLAAAVQAQLKAKNTGERDLMSLPSNPKARISTMTHALVEQWRGSQGNEPVLDGKSQRNLRKAIDGQLATIPGDLAKQQYLKDLAASGQTVARMAQGEAEAGRTLRKVPKEQTTVSPEKAPSVELANKSAVPSTLKSVPGGFEINVSGLTRNQRASYQRLRSSDFTAAEINDITTTLIKKGVAGLAKNPKYLNLSADNLASLMHLVNGIDSTARLHDVTHVLLSSSKFTYGVSEWRENVGNTVANSFIVNPGRAFSPFSWVRAADGSKTLRIDKSQLAAARQELGSGERRFYDRSYERNFVGNSRARTIENVKQSLGEIVFAEQRGRAERYREFRARLKADGQLPDSPAADFEQKLQTAYVEFETKVIEVKGKIDDDAGWIPVLEPIVRVLAQPAIAEYRRLPAATRRELAVDGIASVITAAKFNPKVSIPEWMDPNRLANEWVGMDTANMTQSGYVKTYLDVKSQVENALAADA